MKSRLFTYFGNWKSSLSYNQGHGWSWTVKILYVTHSFNIWLAIFGRFEEWLIFGYELFWWYNLISWSITQVLVRPRIFPRGIWDLIFFKIQKSENFGTRNSIKIHVFTLGTLTIKLLAKYWNLSLTKPWFAINERVQFSIHFRNRDQKRNLITWSINSRLDQNWDGMHMRRVAKNWTIAYYM